MSSMVRKSFQFFVFAAIVAVSLACTTVNLGPVGVKDAKLARDPEGNQPTTLFAQDDTFYFLAELVNAPPATRVKASWTALEVDGMQLNLPVDEAEITSGSGLLQFKLANNELWPAGRYKIDLYLNDQLARSLEFQVEPTAAAVAPPADSPTPSPEPGAPPTSPPPTAAPDPGETPAPNPGVTPSPELPAATTAITREEQSSAGDTLAGETDSGPPPLPLEPYVHPSGVFSMLVPQGWPVLNEDATSARFGSEDASVGSVFADVGAVYDETEMQEFVDSFAGSFITTFASDYQVIEQKSRPDGGIYLAARYGSAQGNGNADFLFTRQEQVIFVLYFVSPAGQDLASTWTAILDSYQVGSDVPQPDAAGATVTPPPPPPPTAVPSPPTSTPAPLTDQFAPPPGRSRLYLVNKYEQDILFTINNSETRIPAGSETPIDLDAGQYSYSVNFADRSTGGEVSLAPDQSWAILVDAEGNVYYAQQIHP